MRWKSLYPADVGDKMVKTWFALWPVKIGNDCRLFERVTVEFELKMDMYDVYRKNIFLRKEPHYYWCKVRFIDNIDICGNMLVTGVKSDIMGVAAYSNDSNSPKANFSSKKVFDKYDNEIQFGDFVRVDGKVVVQVFDDGTGDLVFSPYGKEDLVRSYWMNSLEVVRPIGSDSMDNRCSESELSGSGKIIVGESEVKK